MDESNSSATRVQSVFNALLDRWPDGNPWLSELWDLATQTRPGAVMPKPSTLGTLRYEETPSDHASRVGKVFDRAVAPPIGFLRWLLTHPDDLQLRDPLTFGAKSETSREWRRKLFSKDPEMVAEAQEEAERQLAKRAAQRGRQKWWLFEGFSHIDCCLITDRCVIFVEGGRSDVAAPSTLWYPRRRQLWRDVEVAREFAAGKKFAVILAVETEADGREALERAAESLVASYPHLTRDHQIELSRHLLGFVTWADVVARLDLPVDE